MTGDELPDLGDMPTLEDIAEEYAHLARPRAAIFVKGACPLERGGWQDGGRDAGDRYQRAAHRTGV
jgi:hypothetical protein